MGPRGGDGREERWPRDGREGRCASCLHLCSSSRSSRPAQPPAPSSRAGLWGCTARGHVPGTEEDSERSPPRGQGPRGVGRFSSGHVAPEAAPGLSGGRRGASTASTRQRPALGRGVRVCVGAGRPCGIAPSPQRQPLPVRVSLQEAGRQEGRKVWHLGFQRPMPVGETTFWVRISPEPGYAMPGRTRPWSLPPAAGSSRLLQPNASGPVREARALS